VKKSETDIIQCECGCTHFTIARDGLIECAECGHPTDGHVAVEADVRTLVLARGVAITIKHDPDSYAH